MAERRLFKAKEAAVYLSIHRDDVYRMKNAGLLPYIRIGRKLRFAVDDLDDVIENGRRRR